MVSEATDEDKMPKLREHCARVELDERDKVTSGGARTYLSANNQAKFMCFNIPSCVDIECGRSSLCPAC